MDFSRNKIGEKGAISLFNNISECKSLRGMKINLEKNTTRGGINSLGNIF